MEGLEDKRFYQHFLRRKGLGHVAVLEVNTVNIPTAEVLSRRLSDGNRGRVVTLAALLEGRVRLCEVVCICDADTDIVRQITHRYELLLVTNVTSVEVYAFSDSPIEKLLSVSLPKFPKSSTDLVAQLRGLLIESFLIRAAAENLAMIGKYPEDFTDFCRFDRATGTCTLRTHDYATQVFREIPNNNWRNPLTEEVERLRALTPPDPRHCVHGHDFRQAIGWYIQKHAGFGDFDRKTLSRLIMSLIEVDQIENEPLFASLLERLTDPTCLVGGRIPEST